MKKDKIWSSLLSLLAPPFLIAIEKVAAYPYLIEELFKFGLRELIIKKQSRRQKIVLAITNGTFFAFSETAFFLTNAIKLGRPTLLITKFIGLLALHITTFLLIYLAPRKKIWPFAGLIGAMIVHYFFNLLI